MSGPYVYIMSENWKDEGGVRHQLFTVGFYKDTINGAQFEPESDWDTKDAAAARVSYLNGGKRFPATGGIVK